MSKTPYWVCPLAVCSLEKAAGLKVGPGVKRAFRKAIPKETGCAHMTELADNTFDYIVQKLYWDGVGQTIEDREAFEAGVFTFLNENDTCRAFNQKDKFMPKVSDFLPGTPNKSEDD